MAAYGDKVLETVADKINQDGFSHRNLKLFRQFLLAYPYISIYLPENIIEQISPIGLTVSAQFKHTENQWPKKAQTASAESYEIQLTHTVINKLSFFHITLSFFFIRKSHDRKYKRSARTQ